MHRIATTYSTWIIPALFVAVLGLSACDSGDPVDGPEPGDVAGTYTFEQLIFEPNAQSVASVNLLDTLETSNTGLRLLSGGEFTLTYQFVGGDQVQAAGLFSVGADRVELNAYQGETQDMQRIMLDREFTLNRSATDDALEAQVEKTVNLEQINPETYEGLNSVPGQLSIRFVPQATTE